MAVDLNPATQYEHLAIYAIWLMEKRRTDPAVAALYHHDIRTKAAVSAGLLDRSYLGDSLDNLEPPRGLCDLWKKVNADEWIGLVPMRRAKPPAPERQTPAMSASTYGNLFKSW